MEDLSLSMKLVRMLYPFNAPQYNLFYDLLALLFVGAFFDFRKILCLRNLDILMLCAWVPLGYYESGPRIPLLLYGWLFLLYFLPRLVYQVFRRGNDRCVINFSPRVLAVLTASLLLFACVMTMAYPFPFGEQSLSDSAEGGMAGARAILDGKTPYGNLRYGWDCYPPAYYYAYIPVELALSDGAPLTNKWTEETTYGLPARALTCLLHCVAIWALVLLGRRLRDRHFGYALAFAWMALPYPLISGAQSQTGHMFPGVLSILALLGMSISVTAGAASLGLLASGAFYPVVFLPVWAARLGARVGLRFLLIAGAVICALCLPLFPWKLGLVDGFDQFLDATVRNELRYFRYSPWHIHEWMGPLRPIITALYLPFIAFASWAAYRRRGFMALVALTGALVVFEQLFHQHTPGRYHLWVIPLLLPVLLLGSTRATFENDDSVTCASAGLGSVTLSDQ